MKKIYRFLLYSILLFIFIACTNKIEIEELRNVQIGDSIGSILNSVGKPSKKVTGDQAYQDIDDKIRSLKELNSLNPSEEIEKDIKNADSAATMSNLEEWQYNFTSNDIDGTYSIFISENNVVFTPITKK